ncbi:Hint domain-containing protein [Rhodophyticola porphyridii]|uniref:Hint domain-containing protein n=1 Tax=Rhodophyticola porphyridii TaxID=1852017 RepID=UPI0035CEF230
MTQFAPSRACRSLSSGRHSGPLTGLLASTILETETGWRAAETIRAGDRVHTLDDGLRPVRRVDRNFYGGVFGKPVVEVIRVAGGVLNACSDLYVMPDQPLLIDHPAVDEVLALPSALVPASVLSGFSGCGPMRSQTRFETVSIAFDEDEIIFAQSGVKVHCPAARAAEMAEDHYMSLSPDQAQALLELIEDEGLWSSWSYTSASLALD